MTFDKVIAYDLETTGYSPYKNEILEAAALSFNTRTGEVLTFQVLLQVAALPEHIKELTGITEDMLEGCGLWRDGQEAFFDFVYKDTNKPLIVGHNIKAFDNNFIKAHSGARDGARWLKNEFWDTCTAHRAANAGKRLKTPANLAAVMSFHGIVQDGEAHRALTDAKAAAAIFFKQFKKDGKGHRLLK